MLIHLLESAIQQTQILIQMCPKDLCFWFFWFFFFFFELAKKFTGIPMCALLATKRYELLYNCGIQLLHIGRPLAAFECLMEAVQVYHSNPRLWLRLAECCISANKGV